MKVFTKWLYIKTLKTNIYSKNLFLYINEAYFTTLHNHYLHLKICHIFSGASQSSDDSRKKELPAGIFQKGGHYFKQDSI